MNKIINLAVAKIRLYLRKYNCRKTNHFVKDYYKLNKRIPIEFEHNIWSKNFYWDFSTIVCLMLRSPGILFLMIIILLL